MRLYIYSHGVGTFFETISYDYTNRRARVDVFNHFSGGYNFTVWEETDLRGNHHVYTYKDGDCTARKVAAMKRACVRGKLQRSLFLTRTENHKIEYEFTIGGSLNAVFYGYDKNQFQSDLTVAKGTCVPIS